MENRKNKLQTNNTPKDRIIQGRKSIIAIIIMLIVSFSGLIAVFSFRFDTRQRISFKVSKTEMEQKELVLYWVRQEMEYPDKFIQILRETNTTLALQGNPDLFLGINGYENKSKAAANLVKKCNENNVSVEIWPVPSESLHCGLSIRSIDCMPIVYSYFKNWTDFYNISVQYYAFDIEDYVSLNSFSQSDLYEALKLNENSIFHEGTSGYTFLNYIYQDIEFQKVLTQNRTDWNDQIKKFQKLINNISSDGFIPRATIQPQAWDYLDGDLNNFKKDLMQSYEISGYDYLSGMYYRSCEWGNNDSIYKVYRNAEILSSISPYKRSAICIGCIKYPAYSEALDVANDVWVSAGVGIDSIRLFLGDSWVYSYENESLGLDSLRDMLNLCREGGTGVVDYNPADDLTLYSIILVDVFQDY